MFKKLFGSKKSEATSETLQNSKFPQSPIAKLHETEELFAKKQEHLQAQIAEQTEIAKKNATTNKFAAKRALTKKKRLEADLENVLKMQTTVEVQREALESAKLNIEVVNNMALASRELKTVHKKLDVDKVHDLMDEIGEQQEIDTEITDAMTAPITSTSVDDSELEKELEMLEQEELDSSLLSVHETLTPDSQNIDEKSAKLPFSHSKKSKEVAEKEATEGELIELQKWTES